MKIIIDPMWGWGNAPHISIVLDKKPELQKVWTKHEFGNHFIYICENKSPNLPTFYTGYVSEFNDTSGLRGSGFGGSDIRLDGQKTWTNDEVILRGPRSGRGEVYGEVLGIPMVDMDIKYPADGYISSMCIYLPIETMNVIFTKHSYVWNIERIPGKFKGDLKFNGVAKDSSWEKDEINPFCQFNL